MGEGEAPRKIHSLNEECGRKSIGFLLVFMEKCTKKWKIFWSKGGGFIKTSFKNQNFSTNEGGRGLLRRGILLDDPVYFKFLTKTYVFKNLKRYLWVENFQILRKEGGGL